MRIRHIKNFKEWNDLDEVDHSLLQSVDYLETDDEITLPHYTDEDDEFIRAIFATDEVTGMPCTDLGLQSLHSDADDPEKARYARKVLGRAHQAGARAETADEALALTPRATDTAQSYEDRIADYFENRNDKSD